MNADEIARLCASMTLKEREGSIRTLKADMKDAGLRKMATSLVGKVLSSKTVNMDSFYAVMRKIWQTRDDVEIEPVTRNIFAFHFQNIDDKRKIISGGPWSFNDTLLMLEEPEGKGIFNMSKGRCLGGWSGIGYASEIRMASQVLLLMWATGAQDYCLDKPKGLVAVNGEEFLFGFWMRSSVLAMRTGNGGQRWDLRERGKALRPSSDRRIEGLIEDSIISENQELKDMGNLVFKSTWERKEDNMGTNFSGFLDIVEVGHRNTASLCTRVDPLERIMRKEISKHGLISQSNGLIGLNVLSGSHMDMADKVGAPNPIPLKDAGEEREINTEVAIRGLVVRFWARRKKLVAMGGYQKFLKSKIMFLSMGIRLMWLSMKERRVGLHRPIGHNECVSVERFWIGERSSVLCIA
ncbi:hypothetical protein EZV62_027464 [Acer yangbiense]|uniref:DUF4283 domain-containing protein n=1 Tax=Acer yangbiense TaxID=1000413 RepID=A0A5C7GUA8_9ROSI|nr:hypothetical protein EZV62_027464 [Acer yangbiense]